MAVTIHRTPWIDDDGTGTTGTVINNAVKTGLYDEIDAALAALVPAAGGPIAGNVDIAGTLGVTGACTFRNTVNLTATAGFIAAPGSGGLTLGATHAGGQINFQTAGLQRWFIDPAGKLTAGGGSLFTIIDVGVIHFANPSSAATVLANFYNGSGLVGTIVTTGLATAYNTSSDARLKRDDGPAQDLAALRGLVVHDFAWEADGRRDRGLFAQEAHRVFPRAITPGRDERTDDGRLVAPWMTDYSKVVPDLIVGWQQHDATLQTLAAQVAALAQRI